MYDEEDYWPTTWSAMWRCIKYFIWWQWTDFTSWVKNKINPPAKPAPDTRTPAERQRDFLKGIQMQMELEAKRPDRKFIITDFK